ncbi:MAG: esterase-like activity of phytase family protein [Croceibacterium sp.]
MKPAEQSGAAKRRFGRILAGLLLLLLVIPSAWLRSPVIWPRHHDVRVLRFTRLHARTPDYWPRELRLLGAWRLTSANSGFGGYSALLATDGGTLTAISDVAGTLRMGRPDTQPDALPQFGQVQPLAGRMRGRDIEAAAWDPQTGVRWLAYEGKNLIRRIKPGETLGAFVAPKAMRQWDANGGPESMTRLADGRFIVLEEDPPWLSTGARTGLLFPADPVSGAAPLQFSFRPPIGYDPSDMAALPDGRVVILLRIVDPSSPPFFRGMLLVADPATIVGGQEWHWRKLADLTDPLPRDNYEGLAITPDATGVILWLISDDNFASFQRTLLLKLHWDMPPREATAPR